MPQNVKGVPDYVYEQFKSCIVSSTVYSVIDTAKMNKVRVKIQTNS